ncbi:MAG: ThuA domain-containing protein [Acidobacteria bacterium]|nr:ThuA domain-containing protein [Acidobacteriota bacterium]
MRVVGLLWALFSVVLAQAAPKRVLYVTHSAGFRHDSIPVSRQVMESLVTRSSGQLEVVSTEDLSLLTVENLRNFDVVFFFTSGELALNDQQKRDFLAFVREGKAFGGVHSATDTLYGWPEYGELIGAYFDGHPWAQEVAIDVEDPAHPTMANVFPPFRITEEIYQFRDFSRDRVRVLMTLDTATVDLNAPGVNRTDGDFALAWCRNHGQGRVFYTALGHFDETWRDARFQNILLNALLWLAGVRPGDATPRSGTGSPSPAIDRGGVVNAGSFLPAPNNTLAPGLVIAIFGAALTSGATWSNGGLYPLPRKMAGTQVLVNGVPLPLYFVSPRQINAQLPWEMQSGQSGEVVVRTPNRSSAPEPARIEATAPGILAIVGIRREGMPVTIYGTGLGPVMPPAITGAAAPLSPLSTTVLEPLLTIGGVRAMLTFSGLAPLFAGLYQINAVVPAGIPAGPADVVLEAGGRRSNVVSWAIDR